MRKLQNIWLILIFLACFAIAFTRTHLRNRSTIVGYEIGRLKKKEVELLEQRSHLKMQLARLTSKEHLLSLAKQP